MSAAPPALCNPLVPAYPALPGLGSRLASRASGPVIVPDVYTVASMDRLSGGHVLQAECRLALYFNPKSRKQYLISVATSTTSIPGSTMSLQESA